MKKIIFILLVIVSCVCAYASNDRVQNDKILKDKIGQILIVGFNGYTLDEKNPIYNDIKEGRVGGVILFSKNADRQHPKLVKNIQNPEQVKKLTADLQAIAPVPLFITIDQEGGKIARLGDNFNITTVTAKQFGKLNKPEYTYQEAKKVASVLKNLGINVNFAPCVDVEINAENPVIAKYERSYSANPDIIAAHAGMFVKAHQEQNVLTALKHFPGHGSSSTDTHAGFSDVTDTYQDVELLPYKKLLKSDRGGYKGAVMTSHVYNANWDKNYPASMSKTAITDVLRGKLRYDGLVFTDDIQMGALKNNYSLETILLNTINAGSDVIIIGNNLSYDPDVAKQAQQIIFNKVKEGKISEEKIEQAYRRIIGQKKSLGLIK